MPRFFASVPPSAVGDCLCLTGEAAHHISRSLRMSPGEAVTVCDGQGTDYACKISEITAENVYAEIKAVLHNQSEPSVKVTLFQGLPKGDKMELITQKSVELGVFRIVPMMTRRCVCRPDEKSAQKKNERWQKISNEAAQQSQRGILPEISPLASFAEAIDMAKQLDKVIVCYEGGGKPLREVIGKEDKSIGVFIGSEGGFDAEEIEKLRQNGVETVTLGPRILRTETAPLALLSVVMYLTGNMDGQYESVESE